jgi:hypothetical protein
MTQTLYTDAASNFVYVECQTSMGAGKTVMGKTHFELMCWNLAGVTIKNFHSNNGVPHKYQKWIYKIRLLIIVLLIISVVPLNLSQIF